MNFHETIIGIWGFGVVGQAALEFFSGKAHTILVMNNKPLSSAEQELLAAHHATFIDQTNQEQFFAQADLILPSPGIDLRPYAHHHHKFLAELDLFAHYFHHPIIAVTGTVGKTSVTHLLSQLLAPHFDLITGGNIGVGMLGLINTPPSSNAPRRALLEVSSFQLELCRTFAPALAIWTNFFPNHLDRHSNEAEYFHAKAQIVLRQTPDDNAILPLAIAERLIKNYPVQSRLTIFSPQHPTTQQIAQFPQNTSFIYCEHNAVVIRSNDKKETLLSTDQLPEQSFVENWLVIIATLYLLNLPIKLGNKTFDIPEHRLEVVATKNGVTFVNDSKSTLMQATLSAVNSYQP